MIVAVAVNDQKQSLFTAEDRVRLIEEGVKDLPNVTVASFSGLLVEFARRQSANAVVRGLRAVSDFEFEFQMALMNRKLDEQIETIFLMPAEQYTYLSSRIVKEVSRFGGNIQPFVPECVEKALELKLTALTKQKSPDESPH